jgi:unsaturated rhamnogalacturonyl hydrolase
LSRKFTTLMTAVLALSVNIAHAEGPYRNPDNKNPKDVAEGTYPIPYKMPVVAEITESLLRVRGYLDSVTPTRIISKKTGEPIADLGTPVADAIVEPAKGDFRITSYEMGVVHAGLIKARQVTGDARFTAMTERHLDFIGQALPYFRRQEDQFKLGRANSFAQLLNPGSLDDSGSMCAAMIRARFNKIGPDLSNVIATCGDWVANKQVRLKDGTLARNRPAAWSLWADDMYMGVPALAEMGHLTGQKKYYDDAVRNVLNMSKYLYNDELGIYTHGWNISNPDAPRFYWARANGWAVLSMSDLLDVLPKNHPGYPKVLAQLRKTLKHVAEYQSGAGLWHQMLDRSDSYLETSASAIFVYTIAHAINEGWISPTTYGSIAQAGWQGLSARINAQGQVEGTCVGTTFASDQAYYYARPTSVNALHGYGPALLAGAEMIRLITNPNITVQYKLRTYHYMPKGVKTEYQE